MTSRPASPSRGAVRGGRLRLRLRLRDRRIRTKLAMLLALPLAAILALAGLTAATAANAATRAEQARRLVAVGGTAAGLVAQLQRERVAAALVFSQRSAGPAVDAYRRDVAATDIVAAKFHLALQSVRAPASLSAPLRRVDAQLASLAVLRQQVQSAPDVASSVVVFRYRALIADLLAYREGLSQLGVATETASDLRANAALSQAIESLGLMQVAVVHSLDAGQLTPAAQQDVLGANAGFTETMQAFQSLAPARWQALINARVSGRSVLDAERLQGVVTRAGPGTALSLGTDAAGWAAVVADRMDLLHAVERDADDELLSDVTRQRDEQRRTILVVGATVLACLWVMVLIGWWVTRSMTGSLSRLRVGAEAVAVDRLPAMVAQLGTGRADPDAIERLVAQAAEPIAVDGRDEVGQVAAAFNTVAASAVRIAGEQAALRATVSSILLSVARRLQLRADRMMVSLDGLERQEEDPDRLAKLFDLDHVATQIRRLIANLQELSGARAGRPTTEPVSLPDLLRAAGCEIEDYKRVDLGSVDGSVLINREVGEDLANLLAELLDNAATFSAPDTPVVVEGSRVGDLLHLQIHDRGIGMREADLQAIRDRVANPNRMDSSVTQQMGLPVVGRIAARWGITVAFRSEFEAGTRVDITVPPMLFTTATPAPARPVPPVTGALTAPTQQLPPVPARTGPALPAGSPPPPPPPPPAWPLAVGAVTTAVAAPVGPQPPLMIFEGLRDDPQRSWFAAIGQDRAAGTGPAVPAQWQAAAAAAQAAGAAEPTQVTPNGLPVRRPGHRVIPSVTAPVPRVPVQRDPAELRRQMSAFETGLGAAGRRTHRVQLEESPR